MRSILIPGMQPGISSRQGPLVVLVFVGCLLFVGCLV